MPEFTDFKYKLQKIFKKNLKKLLTFFCDMCILIMVLAFGPFPTNQFSFRLFVERGGCFTAFFESY